MSLNYMDAIGLGFPSVKCHVVGDPSNYDNIVWEGGSPLPNQVTLDQWLASNPTGPKPNVVTKYQFRKLFTLSERVAVDNAPSNTAIPASYRAMLLTMAKDMELSAEVQLDNPDVIGGINFLEQLGLIGVGRAAMILSNTPHA
jgi:hypothetical protein